MIISILGCLLSLLRIGLAGVSAIESWRQFRHSSKSVSAWLLLWRAADARAKKSSSEHADDDLHTNCLNVDGATNYVHDAAGNNLGASADSRTYNDNSQLTSIGGVDMEYSDLGNPVRTQAGATSFVNSPLGITAKKTGSAIT